MTEASDFPEKGMTFTQFAQHVIPGLSDADADYVLWNETPFPLAQGRDDLLPYLERARDNITEWQAGREEERVRLAAHRAAHEEANPSPDDPDLHRQAS
jgi:hypothetical protein